MDEYSVTVLIVNVDTFTFSIYSKPNTDLMPMIEAEVQSILVDEDLSSKQRWKLQNMYRVPTDQETRSNCSACRQGLANQLAHTEPGGCMYVCPDSL